MSPNRPQARHQPGWAGLLALACSLIAMPASGLTLVDTGAGVLDTSHWQVATAGGSQAHLLRVVTPTDQLTYAVDADALLADGSPLVMTWRRDAGDADTLNLALALVVDSRPCHVDLRLISDDGPAPAIAAVGDISTNAAILLASPQRALLRFDASISPLTDVLIGAVDTTIARSVQPWILDVANVAVGDEFSLILRAGPPGDMDDDDDVDLADFAVLHACLDGSATGLSCDAYFDFDADRDVDLSDFAAFQTLFTGDAVAAACGG